MMDIEKQLEELYEEIAVTVNNMIPETGRNFIFMDRYQKMEEERISFIISLAIKKRIIIA